MRTPVARSRLSSNETEQRAMQRRSFKYILSFPDRLEQEAARLRTEAETLPHGHQRDLLETKARQAETASHVNEWLTSPGLQAPK
jgi:hypothetical protein